MSITYFDNPARRLLTILTKAKLIPINESAFSAWREIFDLSDDTATKDILMKIGKLYKLLEEVNEFIKVTAPNSLEDNNYWTTQVLYFLAQSNLSNLNKSWADSICYIDEHTIKYLRMTVQIIDFNLDKTQNNHLKNLDTNKIKDINGSIKKLYEEVLNSDLNEQLKISVLKYLSRLIQTLEEYWITGSEAVLEAIELTIGHMAVDSKYREFMTKEPLGSSIMQKVGDVIIIMTAAKGFLEIIEKTNILLN